MPVDTDARVAAQARLDLPEAQRGLRQAEIHEATLRPAVEALDRADLRRRKRALLPRVAAAYHKVDALPVKASDAREEVRRALAEVGPVSPTDVNAMSALTWAELHLLDLRRQMVKAWTQHNGTGT